MAKIRFDRLKMPEVQDEVKHRKQKDFTGIVIAKYQTDPDPVTEDRIWLLDIRLSNDTIRYATPAKNWETIRTEEERWT